MQFTCQPHRLLFSSHACQVGARPQDKARKGARSTFVTPPCFRSTEKKTHLFLLKKLQETYTGYSYLHTVCWTAEIRTKPLLFTLKQKAGPNKSKILQGKEKRRDFLLTHFLALLQKYITHCRPFNWCWLPPF